MTHKQRVLELLRDNRWHSHTEGYSLNVMLHSRVADLRADGYVIDCRRNGDLYEYRLVGNLNDIPDADSLLAEEEIGLGGGLPGDKLVGPSVPAASSANSGLLSEGSAEPASARPGLAGPSLSNGTEAGADRVVAQLTLEDAA